MDPSGLLISVTSIVNTLDRVQGAFDAAANTLSLLRPQVKVLETGVRHIQEWLQFTEPARRAQVMRSLRDVIATVNGSVQRLQDDLDSAIVSVPSSISGSTSAAGADRPLRVNLAYDDGRMRVHLTDVKEPLGQDAQREIQELQLGAQTLNRAHSSVRRRDRRSVVKEQRSEQRQDHSDVFNTFINSVLDAEGEFAEDNFSSAGRLSQQSSRETLSIHEEYQIPGLGDQSPGLQGRESASAGLERRPLVSEKGIPISIPDLRKQVTRKPVGKSARSPSINTLDTASLRSDRTGWDQGRSQPSGSGGQGYNLRQLRSGTSTDALFRQASGSLNSHIEDPTAIVVQHYEESPPPYVHERINPSEISDLKRRDAETSSGNDASDLDVIQIIRENRGDLLRTLLARGVNLDEIDPTTRRTALMEAAALRRNSLSQMLVQSGSRLHLKDSVGNTALHYAGAAGNARTCSVLVEGGAQLEEYNVHGETPLDLAARGGHTEAVSCLLNSWTIQKARGTTLIKGFLEASRSGSVSTANAFLDRGVKPRKIKESYKPVAFAAQSGSIPMLDFMLSNKCNLKDRSPQGWSALHFAARHGHTAMVEKLLALKLSWKAQTKKTEETALHLAVLAGHTSTAMALIMHKDSVISVKDKDAQQPLHHAVRNGDLELTSALLAHGAKIDEQNKYGWTSMHIAAAYGHLHLVAEFITRGMNIDDKLGLPSFRPNKRTNQAARKGFWAEIRWPHPGARPLHLALEFGRDEVASILIASGARIDEADSHSWRPLHYAAFNCRPQMVGLLLNKGSSPHSTTDDGHTPLTLGFRRPGLSANIAEKEHICEMLQNAMDVRKKSKLQQLTGLMNPSTTKSRSAAMRNLIWHNAELASTLYRGQNIEECEDESEDDDESQSSSHRESESGNADSEIILSDPPLGPSRLRKQYTD